MEYFYPVIVMQKGFCRKIGYDFKSQDEFFLDFMRLRHVDLLCRFDEDVLKSNGDNSDEAKIDWNAIFNRNDEPSSEYYSFSLQGKQFTETCEYVTAQ
jgi:hypothetical protein